MGRLTRLEITNYRSIAGPIELVFPSNRPVVLIGENNAGKSNIVRALNLILGPFWPGTREPDDNEFFSRDPTRPIEILAEFDPPLGRYERIRWCYETGAREPMFRGWRAGGFDGYVSNDDRDTCMCMCLEADRNLEYQLGYSSKWTMLSRLMHRFHKALASDQATRTELEALFRQTRDVFGRVEEFAGFTHTLQEQLSGMLTSMTHRLEVSFEAYNPANFFHALRLHAMEGTEARALAEMGTGEKQVLAMAFAYAFAHAFHEGIILVIEEPESHLHPLAQTWLARRLTEMTADGLQVVLTTHSPAFINLLHLDGLVLVRKPEGSTRIEQRATSELAIYCHSTGARNAPERTILPFYAHHATRDILESFFANTVVLVEGPTEALALPIYLEKVGLSCAKDGVAVIPVGGKGNLAKWYRLFTCYELPTFVIFDNDPRDDREATKRRDALTAIGLSRDADALLAERDLDIRDGCAVFGQNFEVTMRQQFPTYADHETVARGEGIDSDSKSLLARRVAELMAYDAEQDGWRRVAGLAAAIRATGARLPHTEAFEARPIVTGAAAETSTDDEIPL